MASNTPRTNGLVERVNGRVQREVLGLTLYSHRDLETVLSGFNLADNGRRQRVLKGRSPDRVLRERLATKPELANKRAKPPDPAALPRALQVVARAKEVSHPDSWISGLASLRKRIRAAAAKQATATATRLEVTISPTLLVSGFWRSDHRSD